ncbi:MAG: hypothetical protein HYT15_00015 [Candidatus Magasanikbacteria bacterium]|nr:hypothetical protein [Candidatus Magasanikbacteria bacterium]
MPTNNLKLVSVVLGVLVIALAGTSAVLYQKVRKLNVDPQKASQEENQKVIEAVGKLVLLPESEAPTIATVTDPEKLKAEQAFFAKAAQGDKVLIYTQALKAIMYRPSENKIIEIAPLVIGNPNAAPAPAPAAPASTSENQ